MTGFKLLALVTLLAGLLTSSSAEEYEFLDRFNNAFANYSSETELQLQTLRQWNSDLIEEFNRELLLQFGRLVPKLREGDAAFLQEITLADQISETCRNEVLYLRQVYIGFQNSDINYCAYYAHYGVDQDSKNRFFPYHNPLAKENSRAVYQTIQTLGRRSIYDVDGLQYELQEQLDYYLNLRDGQTEVLWEEIAAHANEAYRIYQELDACRIRAEALQQGDHSFIRTYLDNNCWYEEATTSSSIQL